MPGGLAVVGSLGNGSHKMSWISLTDAIEVMMACLQNSNFAGLSTSSHLKWSAIARLPKRSARPGSALLCRRFQQLLSA